LYPYELGQNLSIFIPETKFDNLFHISHQFVECSSLAVTTSQLRDLSHIIPIFISLNNHIELFYGSIHLRFLSLSR